MPLPMADTNAVQPNRWRDDAVRAQYAAIFHQRMILTVVVPPMQDNVLGQRLLELREERDDLPLVNALRDDVRRWLAQLKG